MPPKNPKIFDRDSTGKNFTDVTLLDFYYAAILIGQLAGGSIDTKGAFVLAKEALNIRGAST